MLAFLITRQRTGSGALGSILDKHPALFYAGEVLHPNDDNNPFNFFLFLKSNKILAADFANLSLRAGVIKKYFDHLEASKAPRRQILDFKYRSLQHWNQGWQGFFERPWIIGYARQHQIPILHLRRRNYVATFVSGRLAEKNQVWHTNNAASLRVHSITVPPKELRGFLNACVREAVLMTEWLINYDKVMTLEYEDMLDQNGNMPERVASGLANFLGIEAFTSRNAVFIKQTPAKLSDCIENFDEVAASLRDTEFSWMMQTN